ESVFLKPNLLLRGIYSPDPNFPIYRSVDWDLVTYKVEDESILSFDATSDELKVIGSGSTNIDVFEDGEYRGTYSVDINNLGGDPVVFYYKSASPTDYELTIQVVGEGSSFPSVGTHQYPAGQTVSLSTINSVPGYAFEKWVIDGVDVYYPNPFAQMINIVMDRDRVAQAVFKPISPTQFTLNVN